MLGGVHGEVGVAQELIARCTEAPVGDTDAGPDVQIRSGDRERLVERVEQLLGDHFCVVLVRHVFDEDRELVAAHPGGGIGGTKASPESVRDGDQQHVTGGVPETVVHGLELVEVDEQHGHRAHAPFGAGERMAETIREERLVGEVRERVVERLVRQRDLQADALRDVAHAPHPTHDLSVDPLRHVAALEGSSVVELDDVLAAAVRMFGDILDPAHELGRVLHLWQNDRQDLLTCQRRREGGRQAEQLPEPLVEVRDEAARVDHQDPVGGRIERRVELRQRLGQLGLGLLAGRDVLGGPRDDGDPAVHETRDVRRAMQPPLLAARRLHPEVTAERQAGTQCFVDAVLQRRSVRGVDV